MPPTPPSPILLQQPHGLERSLLCCTFRPEFVAFYAQQGNPLCPGFLFFLLLFIIYYLLLFIFIFFFFLFFFCIFFLYIFFLFSLFSLLCCAFRPEFVAFYAQQGNPLCPGLFNYYFFLIFFF